jgi:hypothetical protein
MLSGALQARPAGAGITHHTETSADAQVVCYCVSTDPTGAQWDLGR